MTDHCNPDGKGDDMTARDLAVTFPNPEILRRLALSGSGFVFDPVSGHSFTVNATGYSVLRKLQQSVSVIELVDELHDEFDVEHGVVERDVLEFAGVLRNYFK
jgi:hypothetical protein